MVSLSHIHTTGREGQGRNRASQIPMVDGSHGHAKQSWPWSQHGRGPLTRESVFPRIFEIFPRVHFTLRSLKSFALTISPPWYLSFLSSKSSAVAEGGFSFNRSSRVLSSLPNINAGGDCPVALTIICCLNRNRDKFSCKSLPSAAIF